MQGLDGAEDLDGEEEHEQLVHVPARAPVAAARVDGLEERALVAEFLDEEALVVEDVHLVRLDDGLGRPGRAQAALGLAYHVELPRRGRVFHLDHFLGVALGAEVAAFLLLIFGALSTR